VENERVRLYFMRRVKNKTQTLHTLKTQFSRSSVLAIERKTLVPIISGFHRALLQSITFISRLMHSIIQNLGVEIYVV